MSYTETDPTVPAWAKAQNKPTYTATEVGALPNSTTFVSSFNGSTGAVTYTAPVTSVNTKTGAVELTAVDVGALASSTMFVSSVNGSNGVVTVDKIKTTASANNTEYNLMGTASTNNNTSAVTTYNQDLLKFSKTSSLSRLAIGSTSLPGIVRIYTSADSASGFTDIKSNASSTNERTVTLPDASGTIALTTDIPSVPSWALASSKPTYTASEVGAITSSEVSSMIATAVNGLTGFSTTIVTALPSSGSSDTFYFVSGTTHTNDVYEEYLWINNSWEKLGNFDATNIDLSGYLQSSDIANWAKAANKPSYTASEVGALPSSTTYVSSFNGNTGAITYTAPVTSVNGNTGAVTINVPSVPSDIGAASATHVHGNITSGGDMTATAAIASGDRLVINDESASKLVSSTITFGSSTTQYLANNGTWQNAYDDTALAARVTALEQIPWVTYYTGSTTPSNAQGNNGDLYFQTSE